MAGLGEVVLTRSDWREKLGRVTVVAKGPLRVTASAPGKVPLTGSGAQSVS